MSRHFGKPELTGCRVSFANPIPLCLKRLCLKRLCLSRLRVTRLRQTRLRPAMARRGNQRSTMLLPAILVPVMTLMGLSATAWGCPAQLAFPTECSVCVLISAHAKGPTDAAEADRSSAAQQPTPDPEKSPLGATSDLWFVASCLLLPVIWGILVHLVFSRLRKKKRPDRSREAGWPDYQI